MTGSGFIKLAAIITVDFALVYTFGGMGAAMIVSCAFLIFALTGEQACLFKDGAVSLEKLPDHERCRLTGIRDALTEDVRRVSGKDIGYIKLHVIPSDQMNAYAYGFHSVAVTRGTLNACDDSVVCSVLAHEVSHIMNLDAVVSRLVFANITLVILGLMVGSFLSSALLWLVFIGLCLLGLAGGLGSILVFHGTKKLVKGLFSGLQYLIVFIYQTSMGIASRGCEYRADLYSCQLGYGNELCYYLQRFAAPQDQRRRTLNEILYASHPAAESRISRIKQYSLAIRDQKA